MEREPEHEPEVGPPLTGVAIAFAGVVVLAVLVLAIPPWRDAFEAAVSGDTATLRNDIRELHVGGALLVLVLGLVHVVVWYPTEILNAAVGFVYDFWVAVPLVMFVWFVNAIVAYWIGRHAARPVLYRFISRRRFDRLEQLAERGGVTLLLAMRLVPIVPFSLFSFVAGAAHVPYFRFAWTSVIGFLPLTIVFVYLGSRLEELSPTDPILWIGAAVLIVLFAITHRLGRMLNEHSKAPSAEEG